MGLSLALLVVGSEVKAQNQPRPPIASSELARQNLARVAASTGQLVVVLHRDPGIMLELKRWIARDATDHGQLIADTDLGEQAIYDRLDTDIDFRAIATLIVQKYGYLQPSINPESPLAKQQELLIQERVKLQAQEEEADRAKWRQDQARSLEQSSACDPRTSSNCPAGSPTNSPAQNPGPYQGEQASPQVPGLQSPPSYPTNNSPYSTPPGTQPTNDVTDLMRTGASSDFSAPDQGSSRQGRRSSSTSGSPEDETSSESQYGQRGSSTGSVGRRSGSQENGFEDLSLTSDFLGDGLNSAQYIGSSMQPNFSTSYNDGSAVSSPGTKQNSMAFDQMLRAQEARASTQRLVQRPNPYSYIPSLYDMYVQAATQPAKLERFGMRVFENGTRDLQMIPTDLPVGPDYVLGTGDGVTVDLWGGVSRRFYRVVDREGRISLPEVGPVLVAGKTLADVQESVQKTLRTQFHDVSVDLSLARLRTIRVYVVGDVLRPGAYDIGSLSTPLNALFAAGGPTGRGSLRILKHYRGDKLLQDVDAYDLLLHGVKSGMARLENGDTVMVPPLGAQLTVEGMVRRPAIYEQKDEKNLADALALAGGLLPTATLRHIEVQRVVEHQKRTMLSLDIPQIDSDEAATKQLEAFALQPGDSIRIFPISPFNQDAVYLEGHVVRPGKYSYREGMKVTDLIGSFNDLLPEPASRYGEIIRLTPPDYRPSVQSFNVAEALADPTKAPALKPLDTVQIFGRYDFESAPAVSVLGDVRAPGTYRTSGDIHLSDAVHLAGGLLPDAATGDAQVFRYLPDSTLQIVNVKLSSALDGSPTDNIVLSSRDRLLIHRNAAAADPPTVYVKGEVAHPGRYPLTANMQIPDLIRAAGGLKQSADNQVADLTHYLWKDEKQVTAEQDKVMLADVLAGNVTATGTLNNGDVLSIRQVPGWDDLGASISVRGEVVHPGTFGIRPGERLSSVLLRAGGFSPLAYPFGSVLVRSEVQRLEQRSYGELIQRVREQQANLKLTATSTTDPDQKLSAESALVQWQSTLDSLTNSPPTGRVTVQIASKIASWAGTSRDITVRAGDVIVVPKRPSYVLVQGQVYGPTAVGYRPGKSAKWYLTQAGGTTNLANRGAIFVVHADGTVIGNHSSLWIRGDALSTALQPGDMLVAPEKALGGPPIWKTLFQNAQILSSITTSAILASHY